MKKRLNEAKKMHKELFILHTWVTYDSIGQNIKKAVITSEDQFFLIHNGFDLNSIYLAVKKNSEIGGTKFGASTITQQTVKNLFLWNGRSWFRKAIEAYFTVLVEIYWDKKRILEVYLNIAEFGDGVFGIEAASQKYFHTKAKNLSQYQASLLAVILPNPLKWSVITPTKKLIVKAKINKIICIHSKKSKKFDKL